MGLFAPSAWLNKAAQVPTRTQCGRCKRNKHCNSPKMKHAGRGRIPVLFVGTAPGPMADRVGKPMVGEDGKVLGKALQGLKYSLSDCSYTYAITCHKALGGVQDSTVECCRAMLFNTIRKLQPKVIIPLGLEALQSLIGLEWGRDVGHYKRWLGFAIPSEMAGSWICPTYDPAQIIRLNHNQMMMRFIRQHIRAAFKRVLKPCRPLSVRKLQNEVEVILDPRTARQRLRWLADQEGLMAFDYETNALKPEGKGRRIYAVSFCLEGKTTFACMYSNRTRPLLSTILKRQQLGKIASNLKFEERWTRVQLGHPVANWQWDTMVAAHVLDNRSEITSLKFQAYVQYGIGDYEEDVNSYLESGEDGINNIHRVNPRDLLTYNGMDSLLEYRLAITQRAWMFPDMFKEGQ